MATRWGMCSAGLISNDFCSALKTLPSSEHEVVAVAARQKASADTFAAKYGIPAAYGSYEELAKDPNVEIAYVGTIHPFHFQTCMMLLDHGKHVLCEKPLTMTLKDTQELIAKAKDKKLFFMEGFWTRFFPAVHRMQEEIAAGRLGKINFLRANFCVPATSVARMTRKELGGGGLLDLGCYLVQYADLVFPEQPEKIVALGDLNDEGVDKSGTLVLKYASGSQAVLSYSFDGAFGDNTLTLYGSKGNLHLAEPFHAPTQVRLPSGETHEFLVPDSPYTYTFTNSSGFMYEARCVRQCLKEGRTECPKVTHESSVNIMAIMTEALKQMGVKY